MSSFAYPPELLSQHLAIVGKTGRRRLPVPPPANCQRCGAAFQPTAKHPQQRFCSRKCGLAATTPPDHNARVARETAVARGDAQRGRGAGKSYPKLNGKHAHRVAAEQKLGRALRPGEIAHHVDEDKQNSARDNIEVLPSQAEHASLHFKGKKQSPEHVRKRVESRKKTIAMKAAA